MIFITDISPNLIVCLLFQTDHIISFDPAPLDHDKLLHLIKPYLPNHEITFGKLNLHLLYKNDNFHQKFFLVTNFTNR